MKRQVVTTADGSKTIFIEDWNEHYHSKHGALQEAQYVFIKQGLLHLVKQYRLSSISVLEIGFGTGLNAFLTLLASCSKKVSINYIGVEAYPVKSEELKQLNYTDIYNNSDQNLFSTMHNAVWEQTHKITDYFNLHKRQQFFQDINDSDAYDLIYFDAFGARVQPELWSKNIFSKMYEALRPNGVLVTYAAIGQVKRDMQDLGFKVERLQGPPGKRHMLRAVKL